MFDFVRNNRWLVVLILSLIIIAFSFWGVDSYLHSFQRDKTLVKVGSSAITLVQYKSEHQRALNQLRAQLGRAFSAEALDTPDERRRLLDRLINRRLMELEANRLGLTTTTDELQDFIHKIPLFQSNKLFSIERYKAFLDQQQMSATEFEDQLRADLATQKLQEGLMLSSFVPAVSAAPYLAAMNEERTYAQLSIPADEKKVSVSADQIAAYYKDHPDEFKTPEQIKVSYVTLSPQDFLANNQPTDKELQDWYQKNISQFQSPEERTARHILIGVAKGASADDKAKAKAQADEVRKQLAANPGLFAELAKKFSGDPGSASKGGDLGTNPRGVMVPAFDQTMFSLKKDEISQPVETDFGYHIIQVTGITPGQTRPFAEVKAQVDSNMRRDKINDRYRVLSEQFANLAYEQSDSLEPLAKKLSLQVKTSDWISRNEPPPPHFPANDKLMKALFSPEVLEQHKNTDAIELQPGSLISARMLAHKAAGTLTLEEASSNIEETLRSRAALASAKERGEQLLAQLKDGGKLPAGLAWSKEATTTRAPTKEALPPDVSKALFSLPVGGTGGAATRTGYTLVKAIKVAQITAKDSDQQNKRYQQTSILTTILDYFSSLRQRYPVKIDEDMFAAAATQE